MKQLTLGAVVFSASALAALVLATDAHAIDIERPQVQFVDKLGVNLANGQVTNGLSTVTIGGVMGLSHSVSVYANEFNYPNATGFGEKYYKRAENVQLCSSPTVCDPTNVMRVQDWTDSQSFAYIGPTGYTPINDERHSLEVSGNEFLWTKSDGTVVHFLRPGSGLATNVGGLLTKVEYPNGFTIFVTQYSVNTNLYAYTYNNPVNATDPSGTNLFSILDWKDFAVDVGGLLVDEIVYVAAVVNGNDVVASLAIDSMVDGRLSAAASTAGIMSPVPRTGSAIRAMERTAEVARAGGPIADITKKIKQFSGKSLRDQKSVYENLRGTYQEHLKKYGQTAGQTSGETNRMERELEAMREILGGRGRTFGPSGELLE